MSAWRRKFRPVDRATSGYSDFIFYNHWGLANPTAAHERDHHHTLVDDDFDVYHNIRKSDIDVKPI